MLISKHMERLIAIAREHLYEKHGVAFYQLNEKQQNILICKTIMDVLKQQKARD